MPCNPKQLTLQEHNLTSTGTVIRRQVFDRGSGKALIVQYPSIDLVMSDSHFSFRTDWHRLPPRKLVLLLKCLLTLQSLPEAALEEAAEELEGISSFYSHNQTLKSSFDSLPSVAIKGKLESAQTRPPLALEP